MTERLSDERVAELIDDCGDSYKPIIEEQVDDILTALRELQDHRVRSHESGVIASHIRAIRSELAEMARVLDVKESP